MQPLIPQPKPVPRLARASRPRQTASSIPGQTRPRAILDKAIARCYASKIDVVVDLFQQFSNRTVGKKLREAIKSHIDTLGLQWVCLALAEATSMKSDKGLADRFLATCEELPDRLIASEDRLREEREAAEEKRLEQWEADASRRDAAREVARRAVESQLGEKHEQPRKAISPGISCPKRRNP